MNPLSNFVVFESFGSYGVGKSGLENVPFDVLPLHPSNIIHSQAKRNDDKMANMQMKREILAMSQCVARAQKCPKRRHFFVCGIDHANKKSQFEAGGQMEKK
uniref:Uncharacterized protein n=1 Tax=Romanomermis culicivorax TaxID=13658 RepID=A0A915LE57_ROMCU